MFPALLCLCFTFVISGYVPPSPTAPPLPCPTPEDRNIAYYTNGTCSERYFCCFNEEVIDLITGNFSNMSCCYAYGADGPYKCCGRSPDNSWPIFLLFALPPLPFIFLLFYCFYKTCKTGYSKQPLPTKSANPIPEPIKPDESIELETIDLETMTVVELEE